MAKNHKGNKANNKGSKSGKLLAAALGVAAVIFCGSTLLNSMF